MKKIVVIVLILIGLVLTGCSEEEVKPTRDQQKKEPAEQVHEPIDVGNKNPDIMAPLTGEAIDEPLNNRIIAVMVNNHPKARPQSGLSAADIVFEILAEGNITRLMAMFHSKVPDVIGPVRSARPYYFNLADDYGALYIYHGAAGFIEDMLKNGAADYLNGAYYDNNQMLFKRESFRVAPHNSYLLTNGIEATATNKGYSLEQSPEPLTFTREDIKTTETASDISFSYGNETTRYVYDTTLETYTRFNDQAQTKELSDETPITLDNIFILETDHEVIDSAGRREIDLTSSGDALLLQKGYVKRVKWENRDGRLLPVENGEVVPFVPGQTWVNVLPTSRGIDTVTMTD
ncbi:putative lipoprotein YerB [Halolactibacillus halophilus]|uniref:Lipoprotein YerB n=1 Tax=Halolactibacillus halophilus TaxID=306540 RepID=A0ABQ0VNY8_9BACI|nr:putative lipoprotein YerB [Halolactibacillus halophilus]